MKRIAWSITMLAAILSGCSQSLTRDAAAHILESAQFAKPKTVRIQTDALGRCDQGTGTARDGWNALLSDGWIRVQDESSGGLIPIAMCNVLVTPAGQKHLQPGRFGSNEFLEAVVARPGNIIVNGISVENNEAAVEFSYQMVLTEEGKVLVAPYGTRNARALMRLYDNGWRIVSITKPSVDEMEEAFEMTGSMWGDTQFRNVPWNPAWAASVINGQNTAQSIAAGRQNNANGVVGNEQNKAALLVEQAGALRVFTYKDGAFREESDGRWVERNPSGTYYFVLGSSDEKFLYLWDHTRSKTVRLPVLGGWAGLRDGPFGTDGSWFDFQQGSMGRQR